MSIIEGEDWHGNVRREQVVDFGEAVVMPGLVDA